MKRSGGGDPHQLTIDWTRRTDSTTPVPTESPLSKEKQPPHHAVFDPPGTPEVRADHEEVNATGIENVRVKSRRVMARLPVPKPLPHAVAAGNFGQDERGPIRPSADEVREITENHAGLLIDLLAQQRDAQRSRSEHDNARISAKIEMEVQKYAEDFGERAAEQLLAYSRRQVQLNAVPSGRVGRIC